VPEKFFFFFFSLSLSLSLSLSSRFIEHLAVCTIKSPKLK